MIAADRLVTIDILSNFSLWTIRMQKWAHPLKTQIWRFIIVQKVISSKPSFGKRMPIHY